MRVNPGVWFEIYVQDMARAKAFYEGVFQTTLQSLSASDAQLEMWRFAGDMNRYGSPGALVKMHGMTPGGNGVLVYFGCDDCAVEEARVIAQGGRIQRLKMSIGEHGFISLVQDTEGNMIGLHSMQ